MSIYSDIRKLLVLVDQVDSLGQEVRSLRSKVEILEKEVATLKGREEAIVLLAEKSARKASEQVVSNALNNSVIGD